MGRQAQQGTLCESACSALPKPALFLEEVRGYRCPDRGKRGRVRSQSSLIVFSGS